MKILEEVLEWIRRHRPARIAVLTGAGVSADSGIPTFRGGDGLWKQHRVEQLATPEAFSRNPGLVWEWYEWRRDRVRLASPNAAHLAIAELQRHPKLDVTLITQNVDDLHRRAGSREILELHGNLFRVRCSLEGHVRQAEEAFSELPPACPCGALLRPDVVWFGEPLPARTLEHAAEAASACDLLLLAGTSGVVYPAAGLVSFVRRGVVVEINPSRTPLTDQSAWWLEASASAVLPVIVDGIRSAAS